MIRQATETRRVLCYLISTFSNPAESSLYRNLHPPWPLAKDKYLIQIGWSMFTWRLTQCCAGCRQSWQSGSGRISRKSWDFLTKLINGRSQGQVGQQLSSTVSSTAMLLTENRPLLDVWSGSPTCSEAWCVPDVTLLICQRGAFIQATQRWAIHKFRTYHSVYYYNHGIY